MADTSQQDPVQIYSSIQQLSQAIRMGSSNELGSHAVEKEALRKTVLQFSVLADIPKLGEEIEALSKEWHNQSPAQSYHLGRSGYIAAKLMQKVS